MISSPTIVFYNNDFNLLLEILYRRVRATSPTRRTRPFCRLRDISPNSPGEFLQREKAYIIKSFNNQLIAQFYM